MRFDFCVFADSASELKAALEATAAAIPAEVFGGTRGFSVNVSPEWNGNAEPAPLTPHLAPPPPPPPADAAPPAAPPAAPAPAGRKRRTRAEIEADTAAANAAAQAGDPPADPESDPAPAADAGSTGMSPGQAKLAALEKLREAYALPRGAEEIKRLQKEYNVSKFASIPDAKGHELFQRATELLAALDPLDPLA